MIKIFLLPTCIILLLVSCTKPNATNNTVYGNIVYKTLPNGNDAQLTNVPVKLQSDADCTFAYFAITDSAGNYRFNNVQSGGYTISIIYRDSAGHTYYGAATAKVVSNTKAQKDFVLLPGGN